MKNKRMSLLKSEISHLENLLDDLDEVESGSKKYFVLKNDVCRKAATLIGLDMSSWFQRLKIRIKPDCSLCEAEGTKRRCDYVKRKMFDIHDYSNVNEVYRYYLPKFRELFQYQIEDIEKEVKEIEEGE